MRKLKSSLLIMAVMALTACSSKPSAAELNERLNKQAEQIERLREKQQYHFDQAQVFLDLGNVKEADKQLKKADDLEVEITALGKKFDKENKDF